MRNDTFMLIYENINFWRVFSREVRRSPQAYKAVCNMLTDLSKNIETKSASYTFDVIWLMYKMGMNNRDTINRWVKFEFKKHISINEIEGALEKLHIYENAIKNTTDKDMRRHYKKIHTNLRYTIFVLNAYGIINNYPKNKINEIDMKVNLIKKKNMGFEVN